jgi:DNA polymerase-3 subunit alpha
MAFISLQDLTGTMETIVFPKTYTKLKELLTQDQVVIVTGKTESRQGNMQIICNHITPLTEQSTAKYKDVTPIRNEAVEQKKEPYVAIHVSNQLNQTQLDQIKKILYRETGDTPVILHLNGTKKLMLPMKVDTSNSLLEDLKTLVGESNAMIQ